MWNYLLLLSSIGRIRPGVQCPICAHHICDTNNYELCEVCHVTSHHGQPTDTKCHQVCYENLYHETTVNGKEFTAL